MRNYKEETEKRVEFIRNTLKNAHADGVVYGNSGGKDCTLVGILCKMATENVLGVIMPCQSKRNYDEDTVHAKKAAEQYNIETTTVDLTKVKETFENALCNEDITKTALSNINPRIRMATLYAIGQSRNYLVAGTGNRSERYMGYFTKWGDGACDFNPISDLTVKEIYEFLRYLNAPEEIIKKAPSAALFEGQTDEMEMGITYNSIDNYLLNNEIDEEDYKILSSYHNRTKHKREPIPFYKNVDENC